MAFFNLKKKKKLVEERSALTLLRQAEGDNGVRFRPGQWEAIDAIVNRRERVLVVQRTGWGKSSVYFLATRILRNQKYGPTLIISPLLSLMRNQIMTANRYGIRAVTINSTNRNKWAQLKQAIIGDKVDVILISPERLSSNDFVENVLPVISERVGLFVVDEAHCISDWGHDFRPDYKRLENILRQMPINVPILGTTATANSRVIKDVKDQLGFIQIQRGALIRQSLALQTLKLPSQASRMAWLAENLKSIPGTGIIYTLTKKDADNLSIWLRQQNISAYAYYSNVVSGDSRNSDEYRKDLEDQLLNNQVKALVATTALGMGYDKPDLGFVIHFQSPGSILSYYQQVGRAGRGIDSAVGILMLGNEDEEVNEYFRTSSFPKKLWVDSIIKVLEDSDGLTINDLAGKVNLGHYQIVNVLNYLSVLVPSPVIKSDSKWFRTPVSFQLDYSKIQSLIRQREAEWNQIKQYIEHKGCLMEFLVNALDDENQLKCGKCSSCVGKPALKTGINKDLELSAIRFLSNSEIPLKCKTTIPKDAFPEYGFFEEFNKELQAEPGMILSTWGKPTWGKYVLQGKRNGFFNYQLVDAVVRLYGRWLPQPAPKWVTCIPSLSKPHLVPNFAERLSTKLGLPFRPVINKVKDNPPQKVQENSFYQCKNLDGVFEIASHIPEGPVLLIDDVCDSGWTLSVAAALLRQAGSGPVWPLALATSGGRV